VEARGHEHPQLGRGSVRDSIERLDARVDHLERDLVQLAQCARKIRRERTQARANVFASGRRAERSQLQILHAQRRQIHPHEMHSSTRPSKRWVDVERFGP
jgi:chromosome segregation ATPase